MRIEFTRVIPMRFWHVEAKVDGEYKDFTRYSSDVWYDSTGEPDESVYSDDMLDALEYVFRHFKEYEEGV